MRVWVVCACVVWRGGGGWAFGGGVRERHALDGRTVSPPPSPPHTPQPHAHHADHVGAQVAEEDHVPRQVTQRLPGQAHHHPRAHLQQEGGGVWGSGGRGRSGPRCRSKAEKQGGAIERGNKQERRTMKPRSLRSCRHRTRFSQVCACRAGREGWGGGATQGRGCALRPPPLHVHALAPPLQRTPPAPPKKTNPPAWGGAGWHRARGWRSRCVAGSGPRPPPATLHICPWTARPLRVHARGVGGCETEVLGMRQFVSACLLPPPLPSHPHPHAPPHPPTHPHTHTPDSATQRPRSLTPGGRCDGSARSPPRSTPRASASSARVRCLTPATTSSR